MHRQVGPDTCDYIIKQYIYCTSSVTTYYDATLVRIHISMTGMRLSVLAIRSKRICVCNLNELISVGVAGLAMHHKVLTYARA